MACAGTPLTQDWFWGFRVISGAMATGLSVGRRGYVDYLHKARFTSKVEEIRYKGGRLLSARRSAERWFIGWTGPHHDLMMGGTGPVMKLSDAVALLDSFGITDNADAMTFRPAGGAALSSVTGTQYVKGVGSVTMLPRARAAGMLPTTPGKPVDFGQLWQVTEGFPAGKGSMFVHASQSGVSFVRDERGVAGDANDRAVEAFLRSLDTRWVI